MGILSKIFGGGSRKPADDHPVYDPLMQREVPAAPKPIQGELPQAQFAPESAERLRAVTCQQFRYGKTLQSPNGPIVRGSEHGATGISTNFPKGIPSHPNQLFLHDDKNFWFNEKYPWKDKGGEIVKKLIETNGKQYVVIAKKMLRSESGEGVNGRMYTEMHEIVMPVEEWSVAVVPQISDVLDARGVTEKNYAMPPIELNTNILDEPLPPNWLDGARDLIRNIVSGKPIILQDWGSQKTFLTKLFYCLICLPENIARQVSFGAGFAEANEGEVRITQAMQAMGGRRKIGENWKDVPQEDIVFGDRYLTELTMALKDCNTPRDIMRAVQNIPLNIKSEMEKRFSPK